MSTPEGQRIMDRVNGISPDSCGGRRPEHEYRTGFEGVVLPTSLSFHEVDTECRPVPGAYMEPPMKFSVPIVVFPSPAAIPVAPIPQILEKVVPTPAPVFEGHIPSNLAKHIGYGKFPDDL